MTKYKNFYFLITPRPDPHADWLLHICTSPDAPHLYNNSYPTEQSAQAAAEVWIETVHKTVNNYYIGRN